MYSQGANKSLRYKLLSFRLGESTHIILKWQDWKKEQDLIKDRILAHGIAKDRGRKQESTYW